MRLKLNMGCVFVEIIAARFGNTATWGAVSRTLGLLLLLLRYSTINASS